MLHTNPQTINSALKRSYKTLGYHFIHFIHIITRVTLICTYIHILYSIYTRASSGDTALSGCEGVDFMTLSGGKRGAGMTSLWTHHAKCHLM